MTPDAEFEAWLLSCGGNIDADTIRCMRTAWDAATERCIRIAQEVGAEDKDALAVNAAHWIVERIRGGQP